MGTWRRKGMLNQGMREQTHRGTKGRLGPGMVWIWVDWAPERSAARGSWKALGVQKAYQQCEVKKQGLHLGICCISCS